MYWKLYFAGTRYSAGMANAASPRKHFLDTTLSVGPGLTKAELVVGRGRSLGCRRRVGGHLPPVSVSVCGVRESINLRCGRNLSAFRGARAVL